MKLLIILIIIAAPLIGFAATVSGSIIEDTTLNAVSEVTVYLQRAEPNPWENINYTDVTDYYGNFTTTDMLTGTYRLYTAANDNYFAGYSDTFIEITNVYQTIENISLQVEPILTTTGSIMGSFQADEIFTENTFYFVSLRHVVSPDYVISMGTVELDEEGNFMFDNLNTGNYKVGLLYYGDFNGEFWYENSFTAEDATMIEITPENPVLYDIDFVINFSNLDSPYIVIDEFIVDDGWDDMITFGETINVSFRLKNIGGMASDNAIFYAHAGYYQIYMDSIHEQIAMEPNTEMIIGPYELTVDYNIPDNFEFGVWYTINNGMSYSSASLPLTAHAPEITIESYEITTNSGIISATDNNILVRVANEGGASINYPMVTISTTDDAIVIDEYNHNNYYYLEAEIGYLDFYVDFDFLFEQNYDNDLDFIVEINSLNNEYSKIIELEVPIQFPTPNAEDTQPFSNNLLGNYPNPFNPETTIEFSSSNIDNTQIVIYNLLGQKVTEFKDVDFSKNGEKYSVKWNGTDRANNSVASGIYFYKLQNGNFSKINKMILSK